MLLKLVAFPKAQAVQMANWIESAGGRLEMQEAKSAGGELKVQATNCAGGGLKTQVANWVGGAGGELD